MRIGFEPMRRWLPLLAACVLAHKTPCVTAIRALRFVSRPKAITTGGRSFYIACVAQCGDEFFTHNVTPRTKPLTKPTTATMTTVRHIHLRNRLRWRGL